MTTHDSPRKSLTDLFSPPDAERRGVFGLVCGLSADQTFIDAALDQFSGRSRNQRQYDGHLSLALLLDAHSEPMEHIPGLYIPWQNRRISGKNGLMHAKVALLGFGESTSGQPDYYRLIVSTGNWTIEAVDRSINLVWSCDYDTTCRDDQRQSARDITESVFFWRKLLGMGGGGKGYYQIDRNVAGKRIEKFLKLISDGIRAPQRGYAPQFISNLLDGKADKTAGFFNADSIGAQVLKHFYSSKKRRNFIICASGFFEQPKTGKYKSKKPEQEPAVLCKIVERLKRRILTENTEQWLVVNPDTSGAAGQWIKSSKSDERCWWICSPKHPDENNTPYPFHAKYIFLGNNKACNRPVTSGILYMGSGNLSKQGFALSPGTGGNIEAGVVVKTERFRNITDLCEQLGIDADEDLNAKDIPDQLEGEESEPASDTLQIPPPIAACVWRQEAGKLQWAMWEDASYTDVLLHGQSIQSPECTEMNIVGKDVDFSRGVNLSAKKSGKRHNWTIPVFRDNGDFWTPPGKPKTGQEIIDTLAEFPKCDYEDAGTDAEDMGDITTGENHASSGPGYGVSEFRDELDSYPLHLATTLVEIIADKNQQIKPGQMSDWIQNLRRTLIDEIKAKTKERLAELDTDVLSPLKKTPGFAPLHASREYRKAIQDISDDWRQAGKTS